MVTKKKNEHNISELTPKIVPILKQHQVSRAAIFGSFATGTVKKTSDLDLLVEFAGDKSLLDLIALKLDLEAEVNRKVDVLTYRSLNPLIKKNVLEQEVRIL